MTAVSDCWQDTSCRSHCWQDQGIYDEYDDHDEYDEYDEYDDYDEHDDHDEIFHSSPAVIVAGRDLSGHTRRRTVPKSELMGFGVDWLPSRAEPPAFPWRWCLCQTAACLLLLRRSRHHPRSGSRSGDQDSSTGFCSRLVAGILLHWALVGRREESGSSRSSSGLWRF